MPLWSRKGRKLSSHRTISLSGKPDDAKVSCPVWTGGKAVRPYLSVQTNESAMVRVVHTAIAGFESMFGRGAVARSVRK